MGVQVRIDGGYQIEKELFFWYTYTHTGLINLSSELGEAMRYNEPEIIIIDYPGEYDVKWRFIKAVLGKNNKLNYLIQWKNKKFWIIQSADVLELDEVWGMDTWLYLWENIEKKFEQLEMEWDLINLETIEKESA